MYIVNVFCGAKSCYDILEIPRESSLRDIKKAYRRLSLESHPDKNSQANATEEFRLISKAYEVLEKNETRKNFDYYLDHPTHYFKVSGHYYFRKIPKSDVRIVLLIVILLISAFQYYYQKSKYMAFVKHLHLAVVNDLTEKQGGSKQTQELFVIAKDKYEETIQKGLLNCFLPNGSGLYVVIEKGGSVNRQSMLKDPLFDKIAMKVF